MWILSNTQPLKNDLEVLFQGNQLLDPNLFNEIWYADSPMSTEEESSTETENLLDSQMSTEEDSSSQFVHEGWNMADFSIEKMDKGSIFQHCAPC